MQLASAPSAIINMRERVLGALMNSHTSLGRTFEVPSSVATLIHIGEKPDVWKSQGVGPGVLFVTGRSSLDTELSPIRAELVRGYNTGR